MKKTVGFIGKRLLQSLIVIFLVTMMIFFLVQLIPGDPVTNFLGNNASKEQIDYYTHLYGYDKPVITQYIIWLGNLLKGDMGFSISFQKNIQNVVFERLGTTMNIAIPSLIIATALGITLGVIAALKRGTLVDTVISFVANIGISMPLFWISIILIMVFAIRLRVLPSMGYVPIQEGVASWLRYLILPITVSIFSPLSVITRQTRAALLEVIRQDYVTTARSKGLKPFRVIVAHQLRNALVPLITILGTQFGYLVGGTVIIESVFVIPGLGSLMIGAINSRDHMLVVGCVMVITAFVTLIQLVVDIMYGIIDPRMRNS